MNLKRCTEIVERALRLSRAPGAALAVIEGEQTELLSFGVQRAGEAAPITESSRFGIASVSKAFTAAAVAAGVSDGKIDWDDPVRKHLPAFRLSDPAADSSVTVRDLLCHRTGLPRHDALWYRTNLTRADLLARFASLPPSATFRGAYQYNNLCFMAAAEALAAAVGKPYEDFLQERLLKPLGMDVTFSGEGLGEGDACPHRKIKGKIMPIEPLRFHNVGPAGYLNASAADLARWMRFQLSGGAGLLDEKALAETHAPQMVQPLDEATRRLYPDRIQQSYCLGWSLYDWQGEPVLSHGGSIDGFRSHLALLPRRKIGFAFVVNLGYDTLPEIVRNGLLDVFLKGPRRSWPRLFAAEKRREKKEAAPKPAKVRPSLPLAGYAGSYAAPGYGALQIALGEDGRLQLSWAGLSAPLKHAARERFICDTDELALSQKELHFTLDKNGQPEALTLFDQRFALNPSLRLAAQPH